MPQHNAEIRKLGGVAEGTSIEITVWSSPSGLALLRGARDVLLTSLNPDRANYLASLLRNPPEKNTEIGGLLFRSWGAFVLVRDSEGILVTCLGPRGAREIARLLEEAGGTASAEQSGAKESA